MFISSYQEFLTTDYAKSHVTTFAQELQRAQQYTSTHTDDNDDDDDDNDDDNPQHTSEQYQDEWMLLCQLQPTYANEDTCDDATDWEAAARELPPPILLSCPNWINSMKTQSNMTTHFNDSETIDISSLTEEQWKAYSIVSAHYNQFLTGNHQDPLHMLIVGTAGAVKSYLIQSLPQLLGKHCLLTATTGIAGFNIGGITLHSALQLPIQGHNRNDLQGHTPVLLQQNFVQKNNT